jgi:putative membrane protein
LLTTSDKEGLTARVAQVEARTGVQVVTAVVDKADHYPELPWKAFALAASLAGLVVVALDVLRPDWTGEYVAFAHVLPVLGAAGASALAAVFVPGYARLFLRPERRDQRTRHYARALFLDHDLCATKARRAVLLLVARFERKVEVVADHGLDGVVGSADWRSVVEATASALSHGDCASALLAGLDRVEKILGERGLRGHAGQSDELPDAPLEAAAT